MKVLISLRGESPEKVNEFYDIEKVGFDAGCVFFKQSGAEPGTTWFPLRNVNWFKEIA